MMKRLSLLYVLVPMMLLGADSWHHNYKGFKHVWYNDDIETLHATFAAFDSACVKFDTTSGAWIISMIDTNGTVVFKADSAGELTATDKIYLTGEATNLYLDYGSSGEEDHDVIINFGDDGNNAAHTFKWDDGSGQFQFSNTIYTSYVAAGTQLITPNVYSSLSGILISTSSAGYDITVDPNEDGAALINLGQSGDNDTTQVNGPQFNISWVNTFTDTSSDDDNYGFETPYITAYATELKITLKIAVANTGACTIQINALGAKDIKVFHDQDPPDNYFEVGGYYDLIYDGTNFQCLTPDSNP
jgi:hypothetical protein